MTNFKINFENPWLLLLLIPAVILTLIPYFRLAKKYRNTRNRIVSIVLHLVIMVLCISVFAGINFSYDLPNKSNEVILLVDTSYSGDENETDKDEFVQSVINSTQSKFKLGIVTFGYDQKYAVELTENMDGVYERYLTAERPDNTASDIASALTYASTLFENPQAARIILLSDGVETDNDANTVIKSIAADGIKVDTVHFLSEEAENELQVIGVTTPDYSVRVGETFNIEITLQSKFDSEEMAEIILYDNGSESVTQQVDLTGDVQTVTLNTTFSTPGMHKLSFDVVGSYDTSLLNNAFNSYMYLEIFDKILIIESIDDESSHIKEMLSDDFKVNVVNVSDDASMPKSVDELRAYDEVILCNVSNDDMPLGFDALLYSYVYDVGGGVFTVSGNEEGLDIANAYTRDDMYGTLYQEMLPVEVIEYTPPVAVMIIIDRSGSMWAKEAGEVYEDSKLFAAKQGAEACLEELSDRDYVGIMSLADYYDENVELTPRPQRSKILAAIDDIELGGGTIFEGALMRARQTLLANTKVEKRHIILVTDGMPGDADPDNYLEEARKNAAAGITMSVVGINCDNSIKQTMIKLVEAGGGEEKNFYDIQDVINVATQMRQDIAAPEIKDVNHETFTPKIETAGSIFANVDIKNLPTFDGFYGTKVKEGATVYLSAPYVPLYAQWKFGKGMVGSFMCDLNGTWSAEFVNPENDNAATLLNNIVNGLFPAENIRPSDINLDLYEKNYGNRLSILTDIMEGESVSVTITSPAADGAAEPIVRTLNPDAGSGQTRVSFDITEPGVHEIYVTKKNSEGEVVSERTLYKSFSYTQEYNEFSDAEASAEFMTSLADRGDGVVIANDDPWAVFDNVISSIHKIVDPRIAFMIIALVLFLTDIAVRKFKFKWPHEIIRNRKAKKELQSK